MTTKKHNAPKPAEIPAATRSKEFDRIHDRIWQQLEAMRCALAALEAGEVMGDAAAGLNLLRRTYDALDKLHDELAKWHMEFLGYPVRAVPPDRDGP